MELNYSFENSMENTFLVIKENQYFQMEEQKNDYKTQMLLKNQIPGLLRIEKRERFGEEQFYYNISRMQSLKNIFEKQEMTEQDIRSIVDDFIKTIKNLEEYLLDENHMILDPEFIYYDMQTKKIAFVYYPHYEKNIRTGFQALADYLLTRIDHTQKGAVILGYELYRFTRNSNYVIGQIEELFENHSYETIEKEPEEEVPYIVTEKKIEEVAEEDFTDIEEPFTMDQEEKEGTRKNTRKKAGVIGCAVFSLLCLVFVGCSRFLELQLLQPEQEMYFIAVSAMSLVCAILFYASMKKEQKAEIEEGCQETVLLAEEDQKAHYLKGEIDGKELSVPISKFPITIGKQGQKVDVKLKDDTVSRVHAKIEKTGDHVYLSDLHSTNGTWKNGVALKLNEICELFPGDQIRFGKASFTFL